MPQKKPGQKPRLFIGSSTESLEVAYAVQENLEHDAEVTVWTQGIFDLSKSALQSLVDRLANTDFAAFVLTPDDVTTLRNQDKQTPRDNVIFELGLFAGHLGQSRCFMIQPRGITDFHLPTDLLGISPAQYEPNRPDGNLVAALGPACNRIRNAIKSQGSLPAKPNAQVLTEHVSFASHDRSHSRFPDTYWAQAKTSIRIFAPTLWNSIGGLEADGTPSKVVDTLLRAGTKAKLLLMHPDSHAFETHTLLLKQLGDSIAPKTKTEYADKLAVLESLLAESGVEIGYYDTYPTVSFVIVDDKEVKVDYILPRTAVSERPLLEFVQGPSDSRTIFNVFSDMFDAIWDKRTGLGN